MKFVKPTFAYLLLAALVLLLIFPIYWTFVSATTPIKTILSTKPPLIPGSIDLSSFLEVINRKPLLTWLYNTSVVTLGASLLSLFLSALAGYSLSRFKTSGQEIMGYLLLLSRMLPGTLLVIPIYIIFTKIGLINNIKGLILMNMTTIIPFTTWMMKGFFDSIPIGIEESARIDGCSWLGSFVRIVLPLTKPGIAAVSVYSFILSWNEFLFARTLAYSPKIWVFTVGLTSFVGEHSTDWGQISAAGILFVIPLVIIFALLEPFLVSGMTAGSVKG